MKFNSIVFPALSLLAAAEAAKLTIVAYTDSVASIYVDGYDVGTINAQTDFTGDALTNYNANGKRFDVDVGGGDHQIAIIARNVNGEDAMFLAAVSVDGFSKVLSINFEISVNSCSNSLIRVQQEVLVGKPRARACLLSHRIEPGLV